MARIRLFLTQDSDPDPFKIFSDSNFHLRTRLFQILSSARDALDLIGEIKALHHTVINTDSDETLDEALNITRLQLSNAEVHLAHTYDIFLELIEKEESTPEFRAEISL